MIKISIHEAKTHLSKYLKMLETGKCDSITITNRGEAAGVLFAPEPIRKKRQREAIDTLRRLMKKAPLATSVEEWIAFKNEGRK